MIRSKMYLCGSFIVFLVFVQISHQHDSNYGGSSYSSAHAHASASAYSNVYANSGSGANSPALNELGQTNGANPQTGEVPHSNPCPHKGKSICPNSGGTSQSNAAASANSGSFSGLNYGHSPQNTNLPASSGPFNTENNVSPSNPAIPTYPGPSSGGHSVASASANAYSGGKYSGPFPGPAGSIHDSKPVVPKKPIQKPPPANYGGNYNFPAAPGNIHDSKPVPAVSPQKPQVIAMGLSPASSGGRPSSIQKPPPVNYGGNYNFPGAPGSIHDSKPVPAVSPQKPQLIAMGLPPASSGGSHSTIQKPPPVNYGGNYNFPGAPGNIHDSKPVPAVSTQKPQLIPMGLPPASSGGSHSFASSSATSGSHYTGPFPGPGGSIHDSKPSNGASGPGPSYTKPTNFPQTTNSQTQTSYDFTQPQKPDVTQYYPKPTIHVPQMTPQTYPILSTPQVYPKPSTPEVYPKPSSPQVQSKPSTPQVYPKPSSPQVYPKPTTSQVYPKPSTPQVYPRPSTPQVYPKPGTPQVYPEPNTSQVYPKPSSPQIYPKPSTPQVYPRPSTPQVYPEPSTPQVYPRPSTPQIYPKPSTPQTYPKPNTPQVYPEPSSPQVYPRPSTEPGASTVHSEANTSEVYPTAGSPLVYPDYSTSSHYPKPTINVPQVHETFPPNPQFPESSKPPTNDYHSKPIVDLPQSSQFYPKPTNNIPQTSITNIAQTENNEGTIYYPRPTHSVHIQPLTDCNGNYGCASSPSNPPTTGASHSGDQLIIGPLPTNNNKLPIPGSDGVILYNQVPVSNPTDSWCAKTGNCGPKDPSGTYNPPSEDVENNPISSYGPPPSGIPPSFSKPSDGSTCKDGKCEPSQELTPPYFKPSGSQSNAFAQSSAQNTGAGCKNNCDGSSVANQGFSPIITIIEKPGDKIPISHGHGDFVFIDKDNNKNPSAAKGRDFVFDDKLKNYGADPFDVAFLARSGAMAGASSSGTGGHNAHSSSLSNANTFSLGGGHSGAFATSFASASASSH